MKVLIGCEESQVVCKAFRNAGHEAYSCDLKSTRGNKQWHFQDDIWKILEWTYWDLIILHPDCTAMAVSGNRWYGKGTIGYDKREAAVEWTTRLWTKARVYGRRVALENPVSVVFPALRGGGAKIQYVQPWQFGHGEVKKTGFALYNLPELKPTNVVTGREAKVWKMGPSKNRKRDRSVTYQGIAEAMAIQWGGL